MKKYRPKPRSWFRFFHFHKTIEAHPAKFSFVIYGCSLVFFACLSLPFPFFVLIALLWSGLWFWLYVQKLQQRSTRLVALLNRFFLTRDRKVFKAVDAGELKTFGEVSGFKEVLFTLESSLPKFLDEIESYRKLLASFESLLWEMNEGVILCEGDGKIKLINPVAQSMLQLRSSERYRILPQLMRSRGILLPKGTGEVEGFSRKLKKKYQFSIHSFADQRKIIFFHDVTEIRKQQSQMEEFRRLVMLGRITAGIAHEIKTPLTNVKLAFQLIQNGDRDLATLTMVEREIERLEHRIREFLSFARGHWVVEEINLRVLSEELIQMVSNTLHLRSLRVNVQFPEGDPILHSSISGVKTLLLNLLINAVDAARTCVRLKVRKDKKGYTVFVFDDGTQKLREQDFEAFQSSKPSGTGLGLAIVQDVAFKIDAHIRYRSTRSYTLFVVEIRNQR